MDLSPNPESRILSAKRSVIVTDTSEYTQVLVVQWLNVGLVIERSLV